MKYFVSFKYLVAFTFVAGNAEVDYPKPIQSLKDINEIQGIISKDMKVQNPVIITFRRFEDDYSKLN